jgi:hypothetical protein
LEAADQVAADSAPAGGADTAGEGEAAAELIAPAAEEPQEEAELTQAADAAAAGALADDASPQATPTVPALEAAGTLPAGPDERTTATEIQPSPEAPDSDAGQLFQTGPAPAAGLRFSPLAVVEILLAATAVGTGVTALVLRRRR